jgi:hypothetical protein
MHSLTQKELETLIKLESEGKLTSEDLYKRVALKTVQNQDTYVTSAIAHMVVGAICVGFAGAAVAPVFLFLWGYSWFNSYKKRTESIRRINAGYFVDYLEEDDRTSYEQDTAVNTVESPVITAVADRAVIGSDTKLRAVEVTAAVQPEGGAAPQMGKQTLIELVALNPKSSFFAAPARTGKGITLTTCIRATQQQVGKTLEGLTVWALTPKQDPKEHWYWETCNRFHNPDIENGDRALAARGIYRFIDEFGRLPRSPKTPTILVVDELTRLLGLLRSIKMEAVDPELFAGDSQSFADWLTDKLILSASMSQSVGYYVWVATPSSTIGKRGFSKGDVDSLNIYTLATKDNLKFADGGAAAFSAPRTDANHPVFTRGYVAGYSHQDRAWFHIPNFKRHIEGKESRATTLNNLWVPGAMQVQPQTSPVAIAPPPQDEDDQPDDGKVEKPNLPLKEIMLQASILAEWIEEHSDTPREKWYSAYNGYRKGFTRPQFRYLLTKIED